MALKNPAVALPMLGLCCLGLIVAGIAITIVLALIPIYTNTAPVTVVSAYSKSQTYTQKTEISGSIPTGVLGDAERAKLAAAAKKAMSGSDGGSVDLAVKSASITESDGTIGRRKRHQGGKHILVVEYIFYGRTLNLIEIFIRKVLAFIVANPGLLSAAVAEYTTTVATTPLAAAVISTTNPAVSVNPGGGRRRRHNADETTSSPLVTYSD